MSNQLFLVGRLTKDIEIEKIDDDKEMAILDLAIPRNFKNTNGEYDTDFVQIYAFNGIVSSAYEYCHVGDLIGIKGRIESGNDKTIRLVAEKLTFLSSSKNLNKKEN